MTRQVMDHVDLDELTVKQVMMRNVITVSADASVSDLVRLLDFEQVSGVPVLDERGQLAGVVSATDVLRLVAHGAELDAGGDQDLGAREDDGVDPDNDEGYDYFLDPADRMTLAFGFERVGDDLLDQYRIADIMTPATFTVRPGATVRELAQFLSRGRIHRALVVDRGALLGIVTTSDVVRAVAGNVSADEPAD